MGPRVRQASGFIPRPGCRQRIKQCVAVAPAAYVVKLHVESAQGCDGLSPIRLKLSQEATAGLPDHLAQASELGIPDTRLTALELECRVALLERAGVAHPRVPEMRFHVEHRPVHPTTSPVSAFLHELVHAGLNDLDGKGVRELGERLRRPAANPRRRALLRDLEAEALSLARRAHDASNDSQVILSSLYETLTVSCAERPTPTEEKHGLEERGLPRAVASEDERQPGGDFQLRLLDAAQMSHAELSEAHGSSPGAMTWEGLRVSVTQGSPPRRTDARPGQPLRPGRVQTRKSR